MATNDKDQESKQELPDEELESVSGGVVGDCTRSPKWPPITDFPFPIEPVPLPPVIISMEQ